MAVTVVGDKPEKTKQCVCGNCGYRLEFTGEDVKTRDVTDYGGGSEAWQYIICPRPKCVKAIGVRWP